MKELIAVTNDKGGVGKTTTAQNLATGLALKGYKVLIIDADSQLYASLCNGWSTQLEAEGHRTLFDALCNPSPLPVYRSGRGLYFTPSSPQMTNIDPYLTRQLSPNRVLAKVLGMPIELNTDLFPAEEAPQKKGRGAKLPQTVDDFDYVIIDCPPSLGSVTLNAMAAATGLIIPVQMEGFAVRGLGNVTAKFKEVQADLNRDLKIRGYLLVMVDERLVITRAYSEKLRQTFDGLVFDTVIRKNVAIPESQDSDSDIFSYAPSSNGAKDYMAFTEEFLKTSKKR